MSFSSKSEFINRIHITNEVPFPSPLNDLHSAMKNSFWSFYVGSCKVTRPEDKAYAPCKKIINNVISANYGPKENSIIESKENYHDLEISGNFAVEIDLLMHEGYRYLNDLYVNHPDYAKLLTNNEINDSITSAAALIDYVPNIDFFDKWFLSLPLTEIDSEESLKMKIRDLLSYAYKRKFFGTLIGYKTLGSSPYLHLTPYPVATIENISDIDKNYNKKFRLVDTEINNSQYYKSLTKKLKVKFLKDYFYDNLLYIKDIFEENFQIKVMTSFPYFNNEEADMIVLDLENIDFTNYPFLSEILKNEIQPNDLLLYYNINSSTMILWKMVVKNNYGIYFNKIKNYLKENIKFKVEYDLINLPWFYGSNLKSFTPNYYFCILNNNNILTLQKTNSIDFESNVSQLKLGDNLINYDNFLIIDKYTLNNFFESVTFNIPNVIKVSNFPEEYLENNQIELNLSNNLIIKGGFAPLYYTNPQNQEIKGAYFYLSPKDSLKIHKSSPEIILNLDIETPFYEGKIKEIQKGYFILKILKLEENKKIPRLLRLSTISSPLNIGLNIPIENNKNLFIEGSMYVLKNTTYSIEFLFNFKNIPEINPITNTNNLDLDWDFLRNKNLEVFLYTKEIDEYPNQYLPINYLFDSNEGTFKTPVNSFFIIEQNFGKLLINYSKEKWSNILNNLLEEIEFIQKTFLTTFTLKGSFKENALDYFLVDNDYKHLLKYIKYGDYINGPGLPSNTYVTYVKDSIIKLSNNCAFPNEAIYYITSNNFFTNNINDFPFSFKRKIYNDKLPDMNEQQYGWLFPNKNYKFITTSYMEGLQDLSKVTKVYNEKIKIDNNDEYKILKECGFNNDIFLALSIDRILYHKNTILYQNKGLYKCLIDIPWFDFIEKELRAARKASEYVKIGAQLNLVTDVSGNPTKSSLETVFNVLPFNFKQNSNPAFIRLGIKSLVAEEKKEVEVLGTSIFGQALYNLGPLFKDEYLTNEELKSFLLNLSFYENFKEFSDILFNMLTNTNLETIQTDLENSIIEMPLSSYEIKKDFVIKNKETNQDYIYDLIHSTIYAQTFKDIIVNKNSVNQNTYEPFPINTPAILEDGELIEDGKTIFYNLLFKVFNPNIKYRYKGDWAPSPIIINGEEKIEYPSFDFIEENDYYVVKLTNESSMIRDKFYIKGPQVKEIKGVQNKKIIVSEINKYKWDNGICEFSFYLNSLKIYFKSLDSQGTDFILIKEIFNFEKNVNYNLTFPDNSSISFKINIEDENINIEDGDKWILKIEKELYTNQQVFREGDWIVAERKDDGNLYWVLHSWNYIMNLSSFELFNLVFNPVPSHDLNAEIGIWKYLKTILTKRKYFDPLKNNLVPYLEFSDNEDTRIFTEKCKQSLIKFLNDGHWIFFTVKENSGPIEGTINNFKSCLINCGNDIIEELDNLDIQINTQFQKYPYLYMVFDKDLLSYIYNIQNYDSIEFVEGNSNENILKILKNPYNPFKAYNDEKEGVIEIEVVDSNTLNIYFKFDFEVTNNLLETYELPTNYQNNTVELFIKTNEGEDVNPKGLKIRLLLNDVGGVKQFYYPQKYRIKVNPKTYKYAKTYNILNKDQTNNFAQLNQQILLYIYEKQYLLVNESSSYFLTHRIYNEVEHPLNYLISEVDSFRRKFLQDNSFSKKLPRNFLNQGSSEILIEIRPDYKGYNKIYEILDTPTPLNCKKGYFNLCESPLYLDKELDNFYVLNKTETNEVIPYYIDFKEPLYFRNLLTVTGKLNVSEEYDTISIDDENSIHSYKNISLEDILIDYEFIKLKKTLTEVDSEELNENKNYNFKWGNHIEYISGNIRKVPNISEVISSPSNTGDDLITITGDYISDKEGTYIIKITRGGSYENSEVTIKFYSIENPSQEIIIDIFTPINTIPHFIPNIGLFITFTDGGDSNLIVNDEWSFNVSFNSNLIEMTKLDSLDQNLNNYNTAVFEDFVEDELTLDDFPLVFNEIQTRDYKNITTGEDLEFKYFKNYLVGVGTIYKTELNNLYPIINPSYLSSSIEAAFSEMKNLLSLNDVVKFVIPEKIDDFSPIEKIEIPFSLLSPEEILDIEESDDIIFIIPKENTNKSPIYSVKKVDENNKFIGNWKKPNLPQRWVGSGDCIILGIKYHYKSHTFWVLAKDPEATSNSVKIFASFSGTKNWEVVDLPTNNTSNLDLMYLNNSLDILFVMSSVENGLMYSLYIPNSSFLNPTNPENFKIINGFNNFYTGNTVDKNGKDYSLIRYPSWAGSIKSIYSSDYYFYMLGDNGRVAYFDITSLNQGQNGDLTYYANWKYIDFDSLDSDVWKFLAKENTGLRLFNLYYNNNVTLQGYNEVDWSNLYFLGLGNSKNLPVGVYYNTNGYDNLVIGNKIADFIELVFDPDYSNIKQIIHWENGRIIVSERTSTKLVLFNPLATQKFSTLNLPENVTSNNILKLNPIASNKKFSLYLTLKSGEIYKRLFLINDEWKYLKKITSTNNSLEYYKNNEDFENHYFIIKNNITNTYSLNSSKNLDNAFPINNVLVNGIYNDYISFSENLVNIDIFNTNENSINVLIIFDCKNQIMNEFSGIPVEMIPKFVDYKGFFIYTTHRQVFDPLIADKIYNPRYDLNLISEKIKIFDENLGEIIEVDNPRYIKNNGYPTYEESPNLYENTFFVNKSGNPLMLCNEFGYYINNELRVMPSYEDSEKFYMRKPLYDSYYDYLIQGFGMIDISDNIPPITPNLESIKIKKKIQNKKIIFEVLDNELLNNFNNKKIPYLVKFLMKNKENITYDLETTLIVEEENSNIKEIKINKNYTGVYIPIDLYLSKQPTKLYFDAPWKNLPDLFYNDIYLKNSENSYVYLMDKNGKLLKDENNNFIKVKALKYLDYRQYIEEMSTLSKIVIDENDLSNDEVKELIVLANIFNDSFKFNFSYEAEKDKLKPSSILEKLNNQCKVIKVDTKTKNITFSKPLINKAIVHKNKSSLLLLKNENGEFFENEYDALNYLLSKYYIQFYFLSIINVDVKQAILNDPKIIFKLDNILLNKYTPNRVCYESWNSNKELEYKSNYPTYEEDPSLYKNVIFIDQKYSVGVYYCNKDGFYVKASNLNTPTIRNKIVDTVNERIPAVEPLYLLNKKRYEEKFYNEKDPSNPYWQYIQIRDYFNIEKNEWEQEIKFLRKEKIQNTSFYYFVPLETNEILIKILFPILGEISFNNGIKYKESLMLDYKKGLLYLRAVANKDRLKNKNTPIYYGISFEEASPTNKPNPPYFRNENGEDNNIDYYYDLKKIIGHNWEGIIKINYRTNDTKNYARPLESNGIVGITEIGVFNTDNQLIAYATMPPIIFDTSKHFLALNIAICKNNSISQHYNALL